MVKCRELKEFEKVYPLMRFPGNLTLPFPLFKAGWD